MNFLLDKPSDMTAYRRGFWRTLSRRYREHRRQFVKTFFDPVMRGIVESPPGLLLSIGMSLTTQQDGIPTPTAWFNTVKERLGETRSVKSTGAKGDGATVDSAAIQSTIDATPEGGAVFFPEGTYIASDLEIKKSIRLFGDGIKGTTIKLDSATATGKLFHGSGFTGHIEIDNLTLDGQEVTTGTKRETGLIFFRNVYPLSLHDLEIKNHFHGIIVGTTDEDKNKYHGMEIERVEIHDSRDISAAVLDVSITNFNGGVMRDCTLTDVNKSMELERANLAGGTQNSIGCWDWRIENTHIHRVYQTSNESADGLRLAGGRIHVTDCTVDDVDRFGIDVHGITEGGGLVTSGPYYLTRCKVNVLARNLNTRVGLHSRGGEMHVRDCELDIAAPDDNGSRVGIVYKWQAYGTVEGTTMNIAGGGSGNIGILTTGGNAAYSVGNANRVFGFTQNTMVLPTNAKGIFLDSTDTDVDIESASFIGNMIKCGSSTHEGIRIQAPVLNITVVGNPISGFASDYLHNPLVASQRDTKEFVSLMTGVVRVVPLDGTPAIFQLEDNTNQFVLGEDGFIGVNILKPLDRFHVVGGAEEGYALGAGGGQVFSFWRILNPGVSNVTIFGTKGNTPLRLRTADTDRMEATTDGRFSMGESATTPAASASLDLQSTTGAFLMNRGTTAQRDALTPKNGMTWYNETVERFQGYQNGGWINLDDGSAA